MALIDGVPELCSQCSAPLCVRKQVINLALGNTDTMQCLKCLARQSDNTDAGVLTGISDYIRSRECFFKEWRRYRSVEDCPDREGCVPRQCFPAT
jgi:hypothetical protein